MILHDFQRPHDLRDPSKVKVNCFSSLAVNNQPYNILADVVGDDTRKRREELRLIHNKEADRKGRHTMSKLVGDRTVAHCTLCNAVIDITGPKRAPTAVVWQRLEITTCEKTSFFKECQIQKHLKLRNLQVQKWNRDVAKNKGEAKTKRERGKPTQMQKGHIFYIVEEKTRDVLACQRPGCGFNKRRPPKKDAHKKNAAGVDLYVDQSLAIPGTEMKILLDKPCVGGEMDWEIMKKEDNGELAPETLLTEAEKASVDQFDPSTQKVRKSVHKR